MRHLIQQTLEEARDRTNAEALARGCCGTTTRYWWEVRDLGEQAAILVSDEDVPALPQVDADKLAKVWAVGMSLTADEHVQYEEDLFRVILGHTTQADWTPDIAVALFSRTLLDDVIRPWRQPTGEHDAYPGDHVVEYQGRHYRSLIDANTTTPDNAQYWADLGNADGSPDPEPDAYPPWQQPQPGVPGREPYAANAIVTHDGQNWINTHGNGNEWEPGVFGWTFYTQ